MASPVHFFCATLKNGHIMSRPPYGPKMGFVSELIHAIEQASPVFAWIQLLFVRSDPSAALLSMKRQLSQSKRNIEQPKLTITGDYVENPQLHRQWYRKVDVRMKKTDKLLSRAVVVMGIQGMWVSAVAL